MTEVPDDVLELQQQVFLYFRRQRLSGSDTRSVLWRFAGTPRGADPQLLSPEAGSLLRGDSTRIAERRAGQVFSLVRIAEREGVEPFFHRRFVPGVAAIVEFIGPPVAGDRFDRDFQIVTF